MLKIDNLHKSSSTADAEKAHIVDPRQWRLRVIGLFGGLGLAILIYYIFPASGADDVVALAKEQAAALDGDALAKAEKAMTGFTDVHIRTAAFAAVLMGAWWMFEAIPLAATALAPLVIFPLLGGWDFATVAGPYANGTIYLFMGGFMIALTMQRWNLHRRIALRTVLIIGTKPRMLILGFMVATGFMSMWVSNTATAVMMLPIGLSVIKLVESTLDSKQSIKRFSTALMLAIAYAASIGSLATPIGTPPNAILIGNLKEAYGLEIGFGQWMLMGLPMTIVFIVAAWWILAFIVFKPEINDIPGGRDLIRKEIEKMGRWSIGQILVLIVFLLTAISWIFLNLALGWLGIDYTVRDETIAIAAALLLFLIPADAKRGIRLLDWTTAKELPWDVLLLFGGGLALSKQFELSGLSMWIGVQAQALQGLPLLLVVALVAVLILALTEMTSNTATASAFIPIMAGVATGIGLTAGGNTQNVLWLTLPVALAATCAFMLPVATPPNAIAYGSGYVTIGEMIKGGLLVGLLGLVLIVITVYTLAPMALGLTFV